MATEQKPVKGNPKVGDTISLGEFEPDDAIGIVDGGTGATTAPEARTNLDVYSKSEADTNVSATVVANYISDGYTGGKKPFIFKEDSNFTYKTAVDGDFFKINGKILEVEFEKTIDMSNEFPEVIVQDQATNGLNVQGAVSAGDYVVVDKEVTTGTVVSIFDATTIQIDIAYQRDNLLFYIKNLTTGFSEVQNGRSANASTFYVFVGDSTNYTVADNISVQLADDTYRATRDTADMYDYENTGSSNSVFLTNGAVIYNNDGNNVNGLSGHYYLCVGHNATLDLSTRNYTDLNWIDLGTASAMSLQNPYFEKRDYISNQILAMYKDDNTIHTEVLFNDCYKTETVDQMLAKNGWSKLSHGLFSKGGVVGSPLGIYQTANKGAFNSFFNKYGKAVKGTNLPSDATSTADCFVGQTGGTVASGTSGYPNSDEGSYETIYKSQWIDLRISAKEDTSTVEDVRNRLNGTDDGIGCDQNATYLTSGTTLFTEELNGTVQTVWSLMRKATEVHQVLKSTDGGVTWTSISFTHQAVENTITIVSSDKILVSYTAHNSPLIPTDSLEIISVDSQVIGTNSHSIYKYNNLIDGSKIATGDSVKGLESRSIENVLLDENKSIQTVPSHNTILLNVDDTIAHKLLTVKCKDSDGLVYEGVIGQEMVSNAGAYDGDDNTFSQLTNGTLVDLNTNNVKTYFAIRPTNKYVGVK